jgi:hypothetical protein
METYQNRSTKKTGKVNNFFKNKKKLTEQAYQLARSQEPKGRLSESDILRAIDLLNSK